EILSPSTAQLDLTDKVDGYFAIPSVQHYLVGDPDTMLVIHHARGPTDATGSAALLTRVHRDRTVPLVLDPPGITVSLDEVLEP
ncbi:MAG: Uma2 family endonuclease, partial [Hyphomicrobiaceae bacterium]|nr:Uma2 family endonuclease [Hyphomicrobiaceae bacterium]